MKTKKKLVITALSSIFVGSFVAGTSIMALADEATKDREYTTKYDAIFEDFDRGVISDTTKVTSGNVDLGEKPFLRVPYTAGTSVTPNDSILKQGSGGLDQVAISGGGTIILNMRAPEGDVSLDDLVFSVRCPSYDKDEQVVSKSFAELLDSDNLPMPALTDEWQEYVISFTNSYEDTDLYASGAGTAVTDSSLAAFHIYATAEAAGTLDIQSVSYTTTGDPQLINDFTGGDTVDATGKISDSAFYWAGSTEGYIVKRAPVMSKDSEFTVVKDTAVGNYKYAVIEAEGDIENLKVATTSDGESWGEAQAYDGYSVTLSGTEVGFKFAYGGEQSVTVKRIYLTNLEEDAASTAVPVIDGATLDILENFNVSQSGFTGDYDAMVAMPQMERAGLYYRLSYTNGDMVSVSKGNLVFDATNLDSKSYIDYKFQSKTAHFGDYIILKVKAEGGASLEGFRFALATVDSQEREVWGDVVYANQFKSSVGLPAAGLDGNNPYAAGDGWYYLVVDIAESGFAVYDTGYTGMNIYYSGTGKLSVNCVGFADEVPMVDGGGQTKLDGISLDFTPDAEGYQYAGYLGALDAQAGKGYNVLAMDVTIGEGTDLSGVRLGLTSNGAERWFGANDAGSLYLLDGTLLANAGFVAGETKTVYIDLAKSGIEDVCDYHVHTNGTGTGAFKLENITLYKYVHLAELVNSFDKELVFTAENEDGDNLSLVFSPTDEGYQYAGYVGALTGQAGKGYNTLAIDITVGEDTDLSGVRLQFGDEYLWFSKNDQGSLYLTDGRLVADAGFVAGETKTVYIDLIASGLTDVSDFHIHTNGTGTGAFTFGNITLLKNTAKEQIADAYAKQLAALEDAVPEYDDDVDPTVTVTTSTKATAGDVIEITYVAEDDYSAASALNVNISVTKDGKAVTLTDNKFTAEEGVYTVTVTATDENGNTGEATVQITVSAAASSGEKPEEPVNSGCGGCASMSLGGGIMGGGITLLCIGGMILISKLASRKKKN